MSARNNERISRGWIYFKTSVAAGAMGLMVLGALATQASAAQVGPDLVVHYSAQDLSTAAGAEKLYARIQLAAQQVCLQVNPAELSRHMASLRCQNTLVDHAVNSIRSPQLTAIYAARARRGAHPAV